MNTILETNPVKRKHQLESLLHQCEKELKHRTQPDDGEQFFYATNRLSVATAVLANTALCRELIAAENWFLRKEDAMNEANMIAFRRKRSRRQVPAPGAVIYFLNMTTFNITKATYADSKVARSLWNLGLMTTDPGDAELMRTEYLELFCA